MPGFAGMHGENGQIVALLVDTTAAPALRATLSARFGLDRRVAGKEVHVRRAAYRFTQLLAWRASLDAVLFRDRVATFSDVDEAGNRVVIGVAEPTAAARVHVAAAALGVPAAALAVEQGRTKATASLNDRVRPVIGGLGIYVPRRFARCTAGFVAIQNGTYYYVSASHCGYGGSILDYSDYFQGTNGPYDATTYIGSEAKDYTGFTGVGPTGVTCPSGYRCRYADASMVQAAAPNYELGYARIARTLFRSRSTGSLDLDASQGNSFTIEGEIPNPMLYEELNRVGGRRGWTYGYVNATCENHVTDIDSDVLFLCQDRFSAENNSGDSGSPVFSWGGYTGVGLYGLQWGQFTPSYGGIESVFSNMANIERDLGALSTY